MHELLLLASMRSTPSNSFDISTLTFVNSSNSVSSQEGGPFDLAFNNDGTRVFIIGNSSDRIHQYSLSAPFDTSTLTFVNSSNSVSSQEGNPLSLAFNNDGTRVFIMGNSSARVHQYSLSAPFDTSTLTFVNSSNSVSSQESAPRDLAFNNDGTRVFVIGNSSDRIHQYSLSAPFDTSTLTLVNSSNSVSSQEGNPFALAFNNDGTRVFIIGNISEKIHQYSLSAPFDTSTLTLVNSSDPVSSQEGNPFALAFNNDGTRVYIMGISARIYQYSLG